MFINQKSFIVHNTVIFTGWVKKKLKSDNSRIFENIQNDNFKIVN